MMQQVPAGWYEDPAGGGGQRYWDGSAWTDQVRPGGADELSQLPPPVAGSGDPAPISDQQSARSGLRRGLIALAVVVPLLAVGVVVAVVLSGGSAVASDARMADFREAPEVLWSVEGFALYDELLNDMDRQWESSFSQEIRSEGVGELTDHGFVSVAGIQGNSALLQLSLYEFTGPLMGFDVDSGEQVWSSGTLSRDPGSDSWVRCQPGGEAQVVCMESFWQDDGTSRATLKAVSMMEEQVLWEERLPSSEGEHGFSTGDHGVLTWYGTEARGTTIRLFAQDGAQLWEQTLPVPPWSQSVRIVGDLVLLDVWDDAYDGAVMDLETGEVRRDLPPSGAQGALRVSYTEHDGAVLRTELREDPVSGNLVRIDPDGTERWSVAVRGRVLRPEIIDPGAPVLVRESDGGLVRALDPDDGEELWRVRIADDGLWSVMASSAEVVLVDAREIVVIDAVDGEERWSRPHFQDQFNRKVYAAQSFVYEIEDDFRLRAFDLRDGEEQWSWVLPDSQGSPRLEVVGSEVLLVSSHIVHRLG